MDWATGTLPLASKAISKFQIEKRLSPKLSLMIIFQRCDSEGKKQNLVHYFSISHWKKQNKKIAVLVIKPRALVLLKFSITELHLQPCFSSPFFFWRMMMSVLPLSQINSCLNEETRSHLKQTVLISDLKQQ